MKKNISYSLKLNEELSISKTSKNMIIKSENLSALQYLSENLKNKIQLIYIDPPYNTQQSFEYYEDQMKQDEWLHFMEERLIKAKQLLKDEGFIWIQIDDNELAYLKVLCDKIFGRHNFRNMFSVGRTVKSTNQQYSRLKSYNQAVEYILCYGKTEKATLNRVLKPSDKKEHTEGQWKTFFQRDERKTMQYDILGASLETGHWIWKKERAMKALENYQKYEIYCQEHGELPLKEYWEKEGKNQEYIKRVSTSQSKDKGVRYWIPPKYGIMLTTNWTDVLAYENNGLFPTGKSERLLERIIELSTYSSEDIVLDFFAGSGTTGIAAHKCNRAWVLIEKESQVETIIVPRFYDLFKGQGTYIKKAYPGDFSFYHMENSTKDE